MKFSLPVLRGLMVVPCLLLFLGSAPVQGEERIIQAQSTKFSPLVLFANPGDMIRWTTMIGHDAQSIVDLVPQGAEHFHIPLGTDGSVILEKEGVYIYKCNPHFALGMTGSIVIGDPSNLEDVQKNAKGMAKRAVIKTKKALENRRAEAALAK